MVLQGSTPAKFGAWVSRMLDFAEANPVHGESFICVNAWNEWAEAAVLEPDVHHGAAYLNALSRAVHNVVHTHAAERTRLVIVGHDAHPNGAQLLALNIGETLLRTFGIEVAFVLGGDGPPLERYRALGEVHVIPDPAGKAEPVFEDLARRGFRLAITNATPSGRVVPALKAAGLRVVSLIHELPKLLKSYRLQDAARSIAQQSDHVIFPAPVVQDGFIGFAGAIARKAEIFPQGLYNTRVLDTPRGDNGLRAELGLPRQTRIVLNVGYAELRKGIDRFVAAGLSLCAARPDVAFLWVGAPALEVYTWFQPEIDASGLGDRVRFLGHRDDVARFFAAADAFYLSSREDPFPSVVLEALAAGLPVIGHEGCGGCDDLIRRHGVLVPQDNPLAAVPAILDMLETRDERAAQARRAEVEQNYDFSGYVFGLLQRLNPDLPALSAVIPNYNYADYIGERLRSVFDQTLPLREVVVLDDASSDDSVARIRDTAQAAGRTIALHVNATNSGSPFAQWRKGVELAKGDYVWIAEADDLADPTFAARLIDRMRAAGSVLGFTDSRQIDQDGAPLGDSYRPYVNQIEPGAFDAPFDMDGPEFLARFLAVKNVILNVSGVIFHRQSLLDAFRAVGEELQGYNVAGDWRLYVELCARPGSRVSYLPEPLNTHRRHRVSVTHALKVEKHLAEIEGMHRIVRERVQLSKNSIHLQHTHLEECRRHLLG
jgi:glycosyltransferase involved in cell wall biosynthesis